MLAGLTRKQLILVHQAADHHRRRHLPAQRRNVGGAGRRQAVVEAVVGLGRQLALAQLAAAGCAKPGLPHVVGEAAQHAALARLHALTEVDHLALAGGHHLRLQPHVAGLQDGQAQLALAALGAEPLQIAL
jgi:hypothetical protein